MKIDTVVTITCTEEKALTLTVIKTDAYVKVSVDNLAVCMSYAEFNTFRNNLNCLKLNN